MYKSLLLSAAVFVTFSGNANALWNEFTNLDMERGTATLTINGMGTTDCDNQAGKKGEEFKVKKQKYTGDFKSSKHGGKDNAFDRGHCDIVVDNIKKVGD